MKGDTIMETGSRGIERKNETKRSERREDATMLLGLKIKEGGMSQRMQAASRGKDII